MNDIRKKALETADYLKSKTDISPKIGFLTGTGLGNSIDSLQIRSSFEYENIPNFPVSTVESHTGRLLVGYLKNQPLMVMQGRFHLYEGYQPLEVTFPIRVMQELGITHLILSNASGGLNPSFNEGDIMIIRDHINLTGNNPLIGPNHDAWGIRFPDMIGAYDKRTARLAKEAALNAGIPVQEGVYAGLKGPSLETPAEMRFLKTIGADAVGFSTVQEVIAGIHAGMKVLGLSTITNINNPENPVPATVKDIIQVAEQAAPKIGLIIENIAENIDD